jgi:hypothetical protein
VCLCILRNIHCHSKRTNTVLPCTYNYSTSCKLQPNKLSNYILLVASINNNCRHLILILHRTILLIIMQISRLVCGNKVLLLTEYTQQRLHQMLKTSIHTYIVHQFACFTSCLEMEGFWYTHTHVPYIRNMSVVIVLLSLRDELLGFCTHTSAAKGSSSLWFVLLSWHILSEG